MADDREIDPSIAHVLIGFTDPEESLGVIADTLRTITDGRVAEDLIATYRETEAAQEREDETAPAYLARSRRFLLPSRESGDVLRFRTQYGWSGPELDQITGLLLHTQSALRRQARDPDLPLDGTQLTLARDADRINALITRWNVLRSARLR